jgi:tetratricopeptide (TPR) repeat protein
MDADDDHVGAASFGAGVAVRLHLKVATEAAERHDWWASIVALEAALDADPSHPEALRMLGDASMEAGDPGGAALAWEQLLEGAGPDADVLVDLAHAWLEACDPERSADAARRAIRLDPALADAHRALAMALDRTPGKASEALRSLVSAFHLDPEGHPLPIDLTPAQWRNAAEQARQRIHPTLAAFWDGVTIRIEDWPSLDEARAADPPFPPTVHALSEGTPPEDVGSTERPAALILYVRNLAYAGSVGAAIDDIANAMEVEGMHWLGIDPADLE